MSMMGELNFFLGLQIKQSKDEIFINQAKYTKGLLKRFDTEESNAFDTPISSSLKLDKDEKGKDVDIKRYRACETTCDLDEGKKIHELAVWSGFELDIMVSTALIDMYMSCSSPDEAVELFQRVPKKDAVYWAVLLCGCVQNGMAHKSMEVFCNMLSSEIQLDVVIMVKILTACSESGVLQQALCLHCRVVRNGFDSNAYVGASLIESRWFPRGSWTAPPVSGDRGHSHLSPSSLIFSLSIVSVRVAIEAQPDRGGAGVVGVLDELLQDSGFLGVVGQHFPYPIYGGFSWEDDSSNFPSLELKRKIEMGFGKCA
ncbi:hypothetical protein RJ640_001128 [Escallonia rubra]|uniref:Pentatricopeptide repeat-containing protein n=1 Tax=Escallonia rubra TaxID=112253 RepID=A0AA88SH05_9ASTE|nr:hypothetical protein RJ640_001128 [Escallonia rubra]